MYGNHSFETHDTHQQLHDILWDSMLFDQEILDAQETEPTLKKMPHDDQDPLNDCEGEKRRKRRRNASESSSKSSKKDKAPTDSTNDDIPVDQPQDKVEELIQNHPNSEWFFDATKKSRIVDVAKERKSN
uniref:Uncharacterized protein n=1 Tax=Tanacetum cinerariifolium TaxID=118510 RepID=A0A699V9E4_TANCI|nr:hypothetical protein [Tanacetum cinerariifolium]